MPTKIFARVVTVLLALTSVAPTLYADTANGPLRIGSILILSGEGSSWGTASKDGIEMAVEKLNADGGVLGRKVEVLHQDDRGDPKASIAAFRQLVDVEKVRFIIGPTWSNLGIPLVEMAAQTKTIMISPSLGVAKFNEANRYLFNTWPHDFILSQKLAEFVWTKGYRSVALVGAEHVWVKEQTAAFKERFEKLGGRIAYQVEPLPGSTDLRTEALRIKSIPGIDAVVSTTDGVLVGSLVAKALMELGVKFPLFSITLDQAAIDAAQGGFERLEFLTFLTPTAQFQSEYEARFKRNIDIGADSAYDAVMLLARAMRAAGSSDPDLVAAKLAEINSYVGVSGELKSDGKRGFVKEYAIKRVVGGKAQ